jgi:hypothetical protein
MVILSTARVGTNGPKTSFAKGSARCAGTQSPKERRSEIKEITAGFKAAGLESVREAADDVKLQRLRGEVPIDDLRSLTGILMGDPWQTTVGASRPKRAQPDRKWLSRLPRHAHVDYKRGLQSQMVSKRIPPPNVIRMIAEECVRLDRPVQAADGLRDILFSCGDSHHYGGVASEVSIVVLGGGVNHGVFNNLC